MIKHALTSALLAFTVASAPTLALAGTNDPGVNKRQQNQRMRIHQGVKSGELTPRETRGLIRGQARVQRKEHHYKADGNLTARERADLHRDLTRTSRQIYRQKHDEQSR